MKTVVDFKRRCKEGSKVQAYAIGSDGKVCYMGVFTIDRVTNTSIMLIPGNDWVDFPKPRFFKPIDKDTAQISFRDNRKMCYRFIQQT